MRRETRDDARGAMVFSKRIAFFVFTRQVSALLTTPSSRRERRLYPLVHKTTRIVRKIEKVFARDFHGANIPFDGKKNAYTAVVPRILRPCDWPQRGDAVSRSVSDSVFVEIYVYFAASGVEATVDVLGAAGFPMQVVPRSH